jgi:ribosomal protein L7Ae-like RNA K-turn-binding protein
MNKRLTTLGLAKRANALLVGETKVYEQITSVRCLFLASDAGAATKNKVEGKCHHYGIPVDTSFDRTQISTALGTLNTVVVGVVDAGFTSLLKEDTDGQTKRK